MSVKTREKKKRIFASALCVIMLLFSLSAYAMTARGGSLPFTLTPNTNGYGSVSLDWRQYNYSNKNFKVYKSSDGGRTYETVGVDYKSVREVKLLQIYPADGAANQFKNWMEINGYGKGIIKADCVHIDTFNANPYYYLKDASGNWRYNVIFFGTWDANNDKDLSEAGRDATKAFIRAGGGAIFGHDTILNATLNHPNFNAFASDVGVYLVNGTTAMNEDTKVIIKKKSLFTNYPWEIGDVGTVLTIPAAHTLGQVVSDGTSYLEFANGGSINEGGIRAPSYLTVKNNCALIMTGHSGGVATDDEQKILANIIFYVNQLLFNTYTTNDASAQDVAKPNTPNVSQNNSQMSYSAEDNGSTYWYYVESFSKDDTTASGLIDRSEKKSLTVTTGVKKYRYLFSNNATETLTTSTGTETTGTSVPVNYDYKYFHVAAVDGAGNISGTKSFAINREFYLDVNTNLDGITNNNGYDDIKFNVYIDGNKVQSSVKDYCTKHTYGSTYKIEMISSDKYTYEKSEYTGTIGATDVSVTIKAVSKPTIERYTCIQNDNDSFYAYAYVTSQGTIKNVRFPSWTNEAGQDDLSQPWTNYYLATKGEWTVNGQKYNYRYLVKTSDHRVSGRDEHNWYNVHIYAFDSYGGWRICTTTFNFKYTLTLNYNKPSNASHDITGNSTTSKVITYKNKYSDLPNPSLVGWKFKGWYTSATGGTQVSKETIYSVPYGVKIYAHWEPITYKVRFNGNGNWNTSQGSYTQQFTYDVSAALTPNKFTRPDNTTYNSLNYIKGYEFIGWGTSATQKTATYTDKQTVKNLKNTDGAVLDLYAIWKKPITLTFNFNGGKFNDSTANQVLNYTMYNSELSHTFDIKPYYGGFKNNRISANKGINNKLTKTDTNGIQYRFLGYSLKPNATVPDTQFDVYSLSRTENYTIRDNTTLYAVWEPVLQMTVQLSVPKNSEIMRLTSDIPVTTTLGNFKIPSGTKSTDIQSSATASVNSATIGTNVTNKDLVTYTVSAKGASNIKFSTAADSRILDIYTHGNNNIWFDKLNTTDKFEYTIDNFSNTTSSFTIPQYIGTKKSYKTSNPESATGTSVYAIKFTCTQPSYYYSKYWNSPETTSVYGILFLNPTLPDDNTNGGIILPPSAVEDGAYEFETILN